MSLEMKGSNNGAILGMIVYAFAIGVLTGVTMVTGYREDTRIFKWSPAWLSPDVADRFTANGFISSPSALRGFHYKRLTADGSGLWSPYYFPKTFNSIKRSGAVAWDSGDRYDSAGSPEWFREDELMSQRE